MTAAALVPSVVQKTYMWATGKTGTPIRLVKYLMKVTKVTQNDWIVAATYCKAGNPIFYWGNTLDSSSDGVDEIMTWTASGTKLTLTSATVGTTYVEIVYEE